MKLTIAIALCIAVALALSAYDIVVSVRGYYEYERTIHSSWSLADKASTIAQKSAYVDKFVEALDSQGFGGDHNALLFPTPDNSFDRNIEALKSLQTRLREIQTMNPASFEYQTAMQQITAQEQGEAGDMLDVFHGVWWKRNYFLVWDWIGALNILAIITLVCVAGGLIIHKTNSW